MIALRTFAKICFGVANTCSTFFRADLDVAIWAGMAGYADTFVEVVASSVGSRTMIWTLQQKSKIQEKNLGKKFRNKYFLNVKNFQASV